MVAKVRIMGLAAGTIMATIMTAHMRNVSRKRPASRSPGIAMAAGTSSMLILSIRKR